MLRVQCFESIDDSSGWHEQWRLLSSGNPFLSPLWLAAVEECFNLKELAIFLAIEDDQHLRGVLPLRIRDGGKMLVDMADRHSDYGGLLLAEVADADTIALALIEEAFRTCRVPRMRLRNLREGFAATISLLAACHGFVYDRKKQAQSFYIALTDDFDSTYKALRTGKSRYNLRRAWKMLDASGSVRLLSCKNQGPDDALLSFLFQYHQKRWEDSKYANAEEREFCKQLALSLAAESQLELTSLLVDDTIVAVHFGFKDETTVYYYNVAYDDTYERYSPGGLLLRESLRLACNYGCTVFDMLCGAEQYKTEWSGVPVDLLTLTLHNPHTITGRLTGLAARLKNGYLTL